MIEKDSNASKDREPKPNHNRNFLSENGREVPLFPEHITPKHSSELANKKETPEKTLSPMEIYETSRNAAYASIDEVMQAKKNLTADENFTVKNALEDLANIEIAHDNIKGALALGDKLTELPTDSGAAIARIYFNVGKNGELEGFEKLKPLLAQEKNEAPAKIREHVQVGPPLYRIISPKLTAVIEECAQGGLPANGWINAHAVNPDHEIELKLNYYNEAKQTKSEGLAIAQNYRDEVTEKFLRGEELTPDISIDIASRIWYAQESMEGKQRIFERVNAITEEGEVQVSSLLNFSRSILHDTKHITVENVEWIKNAVEQIKNIWHEHNLDPFTISNETAPLELSIAHYLGATSTELIDKINEITTTQLNLDIPEKASPYFRRSKTSVAQNRDLYLGDLAEKYAAKGNFEDANVFIKDIANSQTKASTLKACLKKTQTEKDVQAITPDDLTMTFDATFQKLFTVHATIKEGDIEKIKQLAISLAEQTTPADSIHDQLQKCLQTTFALDNQKGRETAREIITILKQREADRVVKVIARKQLTYGDQEGLHTLEELAQKETRPSARLRAFTDLAKEAAEFAQKHTRNT